LQVLAALTAMLTAALLAHSARSASTPIWEWLPLAVLPTIAMLWADHAGTDWLRLGSGTGFRTACYAFGLACGLTGS
jgi:hypothetical protein